MNTHNLGEIGNFHQARIKIRLISGISSKYEFRYEELAHFLLLPRFCMRIESVCEFNCAHRFYQHAGSRREQKIC